jgi:glycerol-3-phosphate dehydrogenase subunit B
MTSVLIIGAGLTGLFAANLAAERQAEVTLVTEGRGGLELSHGCIDVLARGTTPASLHKLPASHPYSLTGAASLQAGLTAFLRLVADGGLPYVGTLAETLLLPTAVGGVHPTTCAQVSLATGDLRRPQAIALAGFACFRDFSAELAASGLRAQGYQVTSALSLDLPGAQGQRDLYATDIGRRFDDPVWRREACRIWKPRLPSAPRLGLPAVLGLARPTEVHEDIQHRLGVEVFEIPTLPPSLPGVRLERLLRLAAQARGVHIVEGARALGETDRQGARPRATGALAASAGGPRRFSADRVILATGGSLHGGLVFHPDGRIEEPVFDLPVHHAQSRESWAAASPFAPQPYSTLGVQVGSDMRPVGRDGQILFDNLFAAGGLLAGADRASEGARQGIDLASAYRAVEEALA